MRESCAEPVERAAGALEGVDDVEGRDSFAVYQGNEIGYGEREGRRTA
jgi:hypothetical protein